MRGLVASCLLAAVLASCNTPTIPLPPPATDKVSFHLDAAAGAAQFQYAADANFAGRTIRVTIFDAVTNYGVIVPAADDGSVAPTPYFPANEGDPIHIGFETEEESVWLCLLLHEGAGSAANYCP